MKFDTRGDFFFNAPGGPLATFLVGNRDLAILTVMRPGYQKQTNFLTSELSIPQITKPRQLLF